VLLLCGKGFEAVFWEFWLLLSVCCVMVVGCRFLFCGLILCAVSRCSMIAGWASSGLRCCRCCAC